MILILLLPLLGQSQDIKNLVFEGAGMRGLAYAGALEELEKHHILEGVERVGGTSAGAVTALAISLGYNARELEELIFKTDFQKFNDGRYMFIGGINRTAKRFGWYRGEKLTHWIEDIIKKKTGNADITFQELHQLGYKDLYITGTSLNKQKLLVFSRLNYPNMKVKDAVRISVSIPLYYSAVCIDQDGRVLTDKKSTDCDNVMVDGGIAGNFPIHIWDSTWHNGNSLVRKENLQTLGFRIDTDEQIAHDKKDHALAPMPIRSFTDYTAAFYSYMLENLNRSHLTEKDWERTVSISSATIGPKIKRLKKEQKELLLNNGRKATQEFLHKRSTATKE